MNLIAFMSLLYRHIILLSNKKRECPSLAPHKREMDVSVQMDY